MPKARQGGHGLRTRYRKGCRCVACSRANYRTQDRPDDLRWPLKWLYRRHNQELVSETIARVAQEPVGIDLADMGLSDFAADRVATALGDHPMVVWPGWLEAGLDIDG